MLDDGDNMRVLPIVTRGIFDNIFDLLYLRGVDAAIVHGDVLEHFKKDQKFVGIEKRINYIMPLFPSEVHVFVRPEINKLEDLAGKPVNFNTKGTAAAYTGPIIFERLGIKVEPHFVPHPVALGEMAKGDKYAAVVFVSTKPLDPFVKRKWPEGFRFLPVPLTQKLEEYYLPAQLEPPTTLGSSGRPDDPDGRCALGAGRVQLAQRCRAPAAPGAVGRLSVRALLEAANRARLPSQVERTQSCRHRARLAALWADAGQAHLFTPQGSEESRTRRAVRRFSAWRSGRTGSRIAAQAVDRIMGCAANV